MPKIDPKASTDRMVQPTIHADVSLPIYWINEEWAVTGFGLESVAPGSTYWIDAATLWGRRGDRADWPAQIETKGWTDPRLFVEAFFKALEIHEIKNDFDRRQEDVLAQEAADRLAAYREMRRRKAKDGKSRFGISSFEEIGIDDAVVEELIKAGFRAPDFPRSCADR